MSDHPGAAVQRQRDDAERERRLQAAVDLSGRRDEFDALWRELDRTREPMAKSCWDGPWPPSPEVRYPYDAARGAYDRFLRDLMDEFGARLQWVDGVPERDADDFVPHDVPRAA